MSQALLIDMFYAAPELWYGLLALFLTMIIIGLYMGIKILKLKQKNYFINRDRERYAETLYASKDGYFAFVYPDEKVNDPRKTIKERCSRRLAVILNLNNGTNSSFDDILKNFYKDDTKRIQKYVELLMEDGVSFEDEFILKNNTKRITLSGCRINGIDGNVYCDMIWFRDVTNEASQISFLEEQKKQALERILQLEDLINNVPYPLWLRDENLNLALVNKKYLEYVETKNKEEILHNGIEILNVNGESISKNLALLAFSTNKPKKQSVNIIKEGERRFFDVTESPFHVEQSLDKICTAGVAVDVTELDDLKRNLKLHQNVHLEIFGTLGTAFAVFDDKYKLSFYNKSFAKLWSLENIWLEQQPSYSMFLDVIREKRLLPEVPDFILFKNGEQKDFNSIIEAKEDLLHLPNGRTFRRVRAPHPMGGLIFAFEDVSDRLAQQRAYNALLAIQKETLDNIFDAVVIFAANGHLQFYNESYLKLWRQDEIFLQKEPSISELIESQKDFFTNVDNWSSLKNEILGHILNPATKAFILNRNEIDDIEVLSTTLADGCVMVTYKKLYPNKS